MKLFNFKKNQAALIIDSLWKDRERLVDVHDRVIIFTQNLSPAIAGIVGKELLVRAEYLSSPEFSVAAYLASEGEAGNDSLMDFIDCVSILPFDRFIKIANNHDMLVDDTVRLEFDEFGFHNIFENRFQSLFEVDGDGLLYNLVIGDDMSVPTTKPDIDPELLFPRLYQLYGSVLTRNPVTDSFKNHATLKDLGF